MDTERKIQKIRRTDQSSAGETRQDYAGGTLHEPDADLSLADDPSELPTRASAAADGSLGEVGPTDGSTFEGPADAVHPVLPATGGDAADAAGQINDDVRRRAYQLWEEEGFPEGGHERHWLQAEQELRNRP